MVECVQQQHAMGGRQFPFAQGVEESEGLRLRAERELVAGQRRLGGEGGEAVAELEQRRCMPRLAACSDLFQHGVLVGFVIVQQRQRGGQRQRHAEVHGNLYGTSRTTVSGLLCQGRDVLLEIDWQGARQIRRSKPDCVSVFILPPSRVELERRLRGRASDSAEVIERRLHNSREEIAHAHEFDYIIVNDSFDEALGDLQSIVHAVRQRSQLQWRRHETLIAELLA